jgi:thioredoxin-related protein
MKFLTVLCLALFTTTGSGWQNDLDLALEQAHQDHKYVLLNFSGSDWCIPCIKMHKEIFESNAFTSYAENELVLVNADFPRLNKNQLSKEQQKKNDRLAETYDPKGHFPYTLLLDEEGKVVRSWEGLPKVTPEEFTTQLKTAMNARP